MNVYGKNFIFNGISSEKYNLVLCSIDSHEPNRETGLTQTLNKGELNPHRNTPNLYSVQYSDVLKFDITIIKRNNLPIENNERREIVAWLTSPIFYTSFKIEDCEVNGYHENIEYFVKSTGCTDFMPSGYISGLTFNFECNAPYGFSEQESNTFVCNGSTKISINNTSDELFQDYYPTIIVKGTSTGEVTFINNKYPENPMKINIKNGQTLIIDCQNGNINDNTNTFDYETDTNLIWLRLVHGHNNITISGNCTGEIQCRYVRKVGI